MNEIRFDNRAAIVTGAGAGLGRSHALGLAARGAAVVVNDLGVDTGGQGRSSAAAEAVAQEIRAAGGRAIAHGADIADAAEVGDLVAATLQEFGRIDILVNNAGILRDKTFSKIDMADFRKVVDVHLMGSALCAHAIWPIMRAQGYGRIVMTSSASGLYGNFGQSNYGAAKAAVAGLMNVLHLEGARDNIRVNTLAPTAATRMTEALMPPEALELLDPAAITPGLLYLVSEDAPSKVILTAGAGCYAATRITETEGILLEGGHNTPESVAANFDRILDDSGAQTLNDAFAQTRKYVAKAAAARGIALPQGL